MRSRLSKLLSARLLLRSSIKNAHAARDCQTQSVLLPRSGSPARRARGAAAKLLPHRGSSFSMKSFSMRSFSMKSFSMKSFSMKIYLNLKMGRNARQARDRPCGARTHGNDQGLGLWSDSDVRATRCIVQFKLRAHPASHSSRAARPRKWPGSQLVAVIPDPRAARSLRFSPSEGEKHFARSRTVDGYHSSRSQRETKGARSVQSG